MNSFSREALVPRYLRERGFHPHYFLFPSPTHALAAWSLLSAAGLCHRNAHRDTHPHAPGHRRTAAAAVLCPSSPPPLLKSSSGPFLPSFRWAALCNPEQWEEGFPRGAGWAKRTLNQTRGDRIPKHHGIVLPLAPAQRSAETPPSLQPTSEWALENTSTSSGDQSRLCYILPNSLRVWSGWGSWPG